MKTPKERMVLPSIGRVVYLWLCAPWVFGMLRQYPEGIRQQLRGPFHIWLYLN